MVELPKGGYQEQQAVKSRRARCKHLLVGRSSRPDAASFTALTLHPNSDGDDARRPFPATPTRSTLLGGMSWVFSLSYFVGQAIAQLAWKGPPPYSMISDAVSDLGVTVCGTVKIGGLSGYYCSPLYLAEDAGFVITGVAIFLGVCLTREVWPRSRWSDAGLVLLALAGAGKVAAGLSPANVDLTIHLLDVPGITLGNIGMIMVGRALRVEARRLAWFTETLGVIGLIGFLGFLVGSHSGIGGLLERIGGYPLIIWASVIGITLVARRHVATASSADPDRRSRSQKTMVRPGTVLRQFARQRDPAPSVYD
jgi:hypothetical membrane protein